MGPALLQRLFKAVAIDTGSDRSHRHRPCSRGRLARDSSKTPHRNCHPELSSRAKSRDLMCSRQDSRHIRHIDSRGPGGPFKPSFGLSGTVPPLDKAFPPRVRVFEPSIPTRSRPVPHSRLRNGENCSAPSPPDARTTQPSLDFDGCSEASPQTARSCEC